VIVLLRHQRTVNPRATIRLRHHRRIRKERIPRLSAISIVARRHHRAVRMATRVLKRMISRLRHRETMMWSRMIVHRSQTKMMSRSSVPSVVAREPAPWLLDHHHHHQVVRLDTDHHHRLLPAPLARLVVVLRHLLHRVRPALRGKVHVLPRHRVLPVLLARVLRHRDHRVNLERPARDHRRRHRRVLRARRERIVLLRRKEHMVLPEQTARLHHSSPRVHHCWLIPAHRAVLMSPRNRPTRM
jgi:hypothetical protein